MPNSGQLRVDFPEAPQSVPSSATHPAASPVVPPGFPITVHHHYPRLDLATTTGKLLLNLSQVTLLFIPRIIITAHWDALSDQFVHGLSSPYTLPLLIIFTQ